MRANQLQQIFESKRNIRVPADLRDGDENPFTTLFDFYEQKLPRAAKFLFTPEQSPEISKDKMITECLHLPDSVCYFESEAEFDGKKFYWAMLAITVPELQMLKNGEDGVMPLWISHCFIRPVDEQDWTMLAVQMCTGYKMVNGTPSTYHMPLMGSNLEMDDVRYRGQVEVMFTMVRKVVYFLHLLSCKNIEMEKVEPMPGKIVNKLRKRGRVPLYSYHIIKLSQPKHGGSHRAELDALTRESPRLHFRRGHIRHLSSGEMTWVTQTMVGDISKGVVEKHYEGTSA